MARNHPAAAAAISGDACCYRLTAKGRACVEPVALQVKTIGSLSRYLHDVLVLCGSGIWFDQLCQFMPPRSLEESLRTLLAMELIEQLDDQPLDTWRAAVRPTRTLCVSGHRPAAPPGRPSSLRTMQAPPRSAGSGGEGSHPLTPSWFVL